MKIKQLCLAVAFTSIGSATSVLLPITTLPAKALTWNLNDVRFDDGGTAAGSFDYSLTNGYTRFNIDVVNPQGQTRNFQLSNSFLAGADDHFFFLDKGDASLSLGFDPNLDDTGGTRNVSGGSYSIADSQNNFRGGDVSGGTVTSATAVPFEFNPNQGLALGVPLFIGLRILKKKLALKSRIKVSV